VLLADAKLLAWVHESHISLVEWTGDCEVDSQTLAVLPVRDGHITGPTAGRWTKNAFLFEHGVQETGRGDTVYQVAECVVPRNHIPGLCAANGVVAIDVNGLHAQRTRSFIMEHWHTQAEGDRRPENPGSHDGIFAVFVRGNCRDEGTRVGLRDATQALLLAIVLTTVEQVLVHQFIKLKGGH